MIANVDVDRAFGGFDRGELDQRAQLVEDEVALIAQIVCLHPTGLDHRDLLVQIGDLRRVVVDAGDCQPDLFVEVLLLLHQALDTVLERVGQALACLDQVRTDGVVGWAVGHFLPGREVLGHLGAQASCRGLVDDCLDLGERGGTRVPTPLRGELVAHLIVGKGVARAIDFFDFDTRAHLTGGAALAEHGNRVGHRLADHAGLAAEARGVCVGDVLVGDIDQRLLRAQRARGDVEAEKRPSPKNGELMPGRPPGDSGAIALDPAHHKQGTGRSPVAAGS